MSDANDSSEISAAGGRDESLLVSLAILQVNWDKQGRSHLDNFVPFAIEAMRRDGLAEASEPEVADGIFRHFGIVLPATVAGAIIKRAARRKVGRLSNRRLILDQSSASKSAEMLTQEEFFKRAQRSLVISLIRYAATEFSISWDEPSADGYLMEYVDKNAPQLLGTALRGRALPSVEGAARESVVVASWIRSLNESDPERFEHLLKIIQGSMLTASLFVTGAGSVDQPFRNTRLIFDTPVLLRALGYEGAEQEAAAREVLNLARSQGAQLVCLLPTVKEVRGVVTSSAETLRNPRFHGSARPVDQHFLHAGLSFGDVMRLSERLERDLASLRIEVEDTPDRDTFLEVDEAQLEVELQGAVGYASQTALRHDLDLLTAVHRIRGTNSGDRIETCRALLVTTNDAVVSAAKRFEDFRRHRPALAMHIFALATILWSKSPVSSPDLPRRQLLANCYAALSPSAGMWHDYLDEIDRLRERGMIADDDVNLLRYSQEAGEVLVAESTRRSDTAVGAETVLAVLERIYTQLRSPTEAQLSLAEEGLLEAVKATEQAELKLLNEREEKEGRDLASRAELSVIRSQLSAMVGEREMMVRRIVERSERLGKFTTWAIVVTVTGIPIAAFVWQAWFIGLLTAAIVTVAGLLGGLMEPARRAGASVARSAARRQLRQIGLPPVP